MIPILYFIVCHAGPAEHFAAFADELDKDYKIEIWAGPAASSKFGDRSITSFKEMNETEARRIAQECKKADFVITDLGHPFDISLQKALAEIAPDVKRFCYYDNPEFEVPGNYTQIANEVMSETPNVLIANAEIASTKSMGIGFYPISKARTLNGQRQDEGQRKRAEFFHKIGKRDQGEKICLYLGGNNSEFYQEAFPAFCQMVLPDPQLLFVLQPHPSSKELDLPNNVRLSNWSTQEMLVIAEVVLYHQTSMAPMVAFAGIPIMQVGKKPYQDLLLRSGIAFASTSSELKEGLEETKKKLYPPSLVGFRQDWPDRLRNALKK